MAEYTMCSRCEEKPAAICISCLTDCTLKQQPIEGEFKSKEIRELLAEARELFINYNEQDIDDGIVLLDQAFTLLKQKPLAGEFTSKMRRAYAPKDPRINVPIVWEYLLQACDIIDSAEARLKVIPDKE